MADARFDDRDASLLEAVLEGLGGSGPDGREVRWSTTAALGHLHFWTMPEEVGEQQPLTDPESGLEALPMQALARHGAGEAGGYMVGVLGGAGGADESEDWSDGGNEELAALVDALQETPSHEVGAAPGDLRAGRRTDARPGARHRRHRLGPERRQHHHGGRFRLAADQVRGPAG